MADLAQLVESLSNLTVMEAAQLKTQLEEKWGVTAASGGGMMMPMMAMGAAGGGAAAPAEEVEEQTEFKHCLIPFVRKLCMALHLVASQSGITTDEFPPVSRRQPVKHKVTCV